MRSEQSAVAGVWVFTPHPHEPAERGLEWFSQVAVRDAAGTALPLAQANCSVSAAGVLRGLHAAQVPPGQAKYVTCVRGAAFDVAVDLRTDSPTYGRSTTVLLDDDRRRAVYLTEGLAHGFLALAEHTTMLYLCSTPYTPVREFDINPFDPELGIAWPRVDRHGFPLRYRLSDKDRAAPDLAQVRSAGLLPSVRDCRAHRPRATGGVTDRFRSA